MSGAGSVPFAAATVFSPQTYQQLIFAVMAFYCIWFAAYRIWAAERTQLIKLNVGAQREAIRLRIAELITVGAGIRNEATDHYNPHSPAEAIAWENRVIAWHRVVLDTLKSVSPADAKWYRTLNEVPPPTIPMATPQGGYKNSDVEHTYAMHNFRLKKLEQLVSGEKGNLLVRT